MADPISPVSNDSPSVDITTNNSSTQKSQNVSTSGGVSDVNDSFSVADNSKTFAVDDDSQTFGVDSDFEKEISDDTDDVIDAIRTKLLENVPEEIKDNPEVLDVYTQAMNAVLSAMKEGLIQQIEQFVDTQRLSQEQSKEVLRSTALFIKEQAKVQEKQKEIADKQAAAEKRHKWLSIFTFGLTALVLVATVVLTVVSGGAAAPALVAEEGLMSGIGTAISEAFASATAEGGLSAVAGVGKLVLVTGLKLGALAFGMYNAVIAGKDGDWLGMAMSIGTVLMMGAIFAAPLFAGAPAAIGPEEIEMTDMAADDAAADEAMSNSASQNPASSSTDWAKWAGRIAQGTAALLLSADTLQNAITNSVIHGKLKELSGVQEDVGEAQAILALNNALFKFFQQILQREGEVLDGESEQITDVESTAADVFQGFQQISAGLSQAV